MEGSPAKPPRYPSARYNQQQPSAPSLSPPQSRGGEDGVPPMPAFPADLSGRTTDEPPSYMDDQMLLPPLAVPLGYGSGSSPPPYASAVPAMPVYRQQYQPTSPYRMSPPPFDANTQTPPAGYFQYSANKPASPPQAFDMHRPRGSHRAYHQMYRQQSPQNQQQQPPSKCASVCYFLKLLLFNAANGFLGVAGFTVVSAGLTLALVTLPLCCFGIVLFRVLLRVVYVGCKIDAVLHNLIASSDEKIQFGAHHHYHHHHHPGHMSSLAERHSLLPTQIDWQLQPHHHQQDEDQLPQFEKTLAEVSPRAVLATIYFGSIKFLVGIFSLIAIGLVSFVIALFVGGVDVHLMFNDDDVQEEDLFTVYMFAIGLAVFSVAMLFANARISQAITRFFCCEGGV